MDAETGMGNMKTNGAYVRTSSCLRPILFLLHAGTTGLTKLIKKPLRDTDNLLQ
jgi:hypothetical protein